MYLYCFTTLISVTAKIFAQFNLTTLNILQWNIRSFSRNKDTLITLIREHNIQIVALNETFFNQHSNPKLKNFDCIRKDRVDGYGGVCLFVHRDIQYREIDLDLLNIPEAVQVIAAEFKHFWLINMYNQPQNFLSCDLLQSIVDNVLSTQNKPIIFLGDFNGHHTSWGSGTINRNGRTLSEFLDEMNFVILNDGSPTRIHHPRERPSALDLAFCSPSLVSSLMWSILDDVGMSDHIPCLLKYALNETTAINTFFSYKKFRTDLADWGTYSSQLENAYQKKTSFSSYEDLMESIYEAANKAIPKYKPTRLRRISNIWWNQECSLALKERREALRCYKLDASMENYIRFRKRRAMARKTFREAKKNSFTQFCESLSPNTPIDSVWRSVRKFANSNKSSRLCPTLNQNIGQDIFINLTQPVFIYNPPAVICNANPSPQFTLSELNFALNNKKDTAPGADSVTYEMIKRMPATCHLYLLHLFNCILKGEQEVPLSWKTQVIHPLPKPGKKLDSISAWRPIALSSCIGKTFEAMIKHRIEWDMERNDRLNPLQMGFRRGRGTQDNLAGLYCTINIGLSLNQRTVVVFLDLKSAYDNVLLPNLFQCLCSLNINLDLCESILQLLRDRQVKVLEPSSGVLVGPGTANKGLPQGSPLSPLLFNLYCNFLRDMDLEGCSILGYADDFAVIGRGRVLTTTIRRINILIQRISEEFSDRGLRLSPGKCAAMCFGNYGETNPHEKIVVDGERLDWSQEFKYLGVIFQQNLSWKSQISHMCGRAGKSLNIIRYLCRTWWGAAPSTLLALYKSLVRPHLEYGSMIFGKCSKALLLKLDRTQYQAIRTALGLMRSTPINILLSEGGEYPLSYRRSLLSMRYIAKVFSYANPIRSLLQELYDTYIRDPQFWPNTKIPPIIEGMHTLRAHFPHICFTTLFPCFLFPLQTLISPIPNRIFNLKKGVTNKEKFLHIINKQYHDYFTIYTDGSKDDEGRTGFGVYTQDGSRHSGRLSKYHSICDAEVQAIYKACQIIKELNIPRALILTDSRSAQFRVTNLKITSKADYWAMKTRDMIAVLQMKGTKIILGWIPSHTNISGNEIADELANEGRSLVEATNAKPTHLSLSPLMKENLWISWTAKYVEWSNTKGKVYAGYNSKPLVKPWFISIQGCSRKIINTIGRMRSGHCSTAEHLYRIGVKASPNCECGEIQNLQHIFFSCTIYENQIKEWLRKLSIPKDLSQPLSIHDVIFKAVNRNNAELITRFLACCNLKL